MDDLLADLGRTCTSACSEGGTKKVNKSQSDQSTAKVNAASAAFADDLTLVVRADSDKETGRIMTLLLARITAWSDRVGVDVNTDKTELIAMSGSTDPREGEKAAANAANSTLMRGPDGELHKVRPVQQARILGVIIDRRLSFLPHADKLEEKWLKAQALMRKLCWIVHPIGIRALWCALGLGRLTCALAWWPVLSTARRDQLSQLHTRAARIITFAISTAESAKTLRAAQLRPLEEEVAKLAVGEHELLTRSPVASVQRFIKGSLTRNSTHQTPEDYFGKLHLRKPNTPGYVPSLLGTSLLIAFRDIALLDEKVSFRIHKTLSRRVASDAELFDSNESLLKLISDHNFYAFSDGSVRSKSGAVPRAAGAGVVISTDPHGEDVIFTASYPQMATCCPYSTEAEGMFEAINALQRQCTLRPEHRVALLLDGQSIASELATGPERQSKHFTAMVWQALLSLAHRVDAITVCFVFGHCDLPGNEAADKAARHALSMSPPEAARVHPLDSKRSRLQQRRDWFEHAPLKIPLINRFDTRLLLRARSGAVPAIGGHLAGDSRPPDPCALCGELALARGGATFAHLLTCKHEVAVKGRKTFDIVDQNWLYDPRCNSAGYLRLFLRETPTGRTPTVSPPPADPLPS